MLHAFPLFKGASPESLARVTAAARFVTLRQGDPLWESGQEPTTAVLMARGLVEIWRAHPDGTEVTLGLFGPRECPGIFAVLDGKPFPAAARVLTDEADVWIVPRVFLQTLIAEDDTIARALNGVLRTHSSVLRDKVDVITAGEVAARLATLLLLLGQRFGDESGPDELYVPLTLTRRILARLVGARVETVIRQMTAWEREAFVETRPGGFAIHGLERLRREAAAT